MGEIFLDIFVSWLLLITFDWPWKNVCRRRDGIHNLVELKIFITQKCI